MNWNVIRYKGYYHWHLDRDLRELMGIEIGTIKVRNAMFGIELQRRMRYLGDQANTQLTLWRCHMRTSRDQR